MASPETTHTSAQKQQYLGLDDAAGESPIGMSMKPPSFSLSAEPIQRVPNPNRSGETNYSFDTGRLSAQDLQDPTIAARLAAMDLAALQQYLTVAQDPEVVRHIQGLIAQRQSEAARPAASFIGDTRQRVLQADEPMYTAMTTYLQALPARIRAMTASPPASFAFLRNNPNVDAILALTERIAREFTARQHIVRFDPSLVGTNVGAVYGFTTDIIRLRPFTNNGQRTDVVASLLHEYTHYQQDAAIEQSVSSSQRSDDHSENDELNHEVEGRRSGSYMNVILTALGDAPSDLQNSISDQVFVSNFEQERTGNRRERREATEDIRTSVRNAYTAQIAHNSPSATHYASLGEDNHVYLRIRGRQVDLGAVPATVTTRDALSGHLAGRIRSDSHQFGVFQRGSARSASRYTIATILVYYHDRKLTEFAIQS